ncbi:MAG: hypothetical protein ACLSUY_12220 [Phascolarctobacterium faecium]|uniref:hypothetical protein n=1 Tax=Phascolarctobacterium faecium TaxID=33025 RepID=UPI00399595C4
MKAWLSILGLYNYDNSIFNLFVVPDGMDKELIINNILLECAEMEIIYPEPDIMKNAIGLWSNKQLESWERMYKAMQLEYDPIYNYDRFEEWLDSNTATTHSNTNSNLNRKGSTKHQVNAFNSGITDSNIDSIDNTDTDNTNTNSNNSAIGAHSGHLYGNIGVTTSQQMLQSEIDISKFIVADYIIDQFKERFCLLVY